jgi:MFS family permease
MALSALKAFVILYLTVGLGYKLSIASLLVGGVALVILLGAVAAGKAGDRFGRLRVLNYALIAYGCGYLALVFTTSRPVIAAAISFVAVGGGTVMTLAYAVLMPLMPGGEHGALTGFYSPSRGIGIVLGPILPGVLMSVTKTGPNEISPQPCQALGIRRLFACLQNLPAIARHICRARLVPKLPGTDCRARWVADRWSPRPADPRAESLRSVIDHGSSERTQSGSGNRRHSGRRTSDRASVRKARL